MDWVCFLPLNRCFRKGSALFFSGKMTDPTSYQHASSDEEGLVETVMLAFRGTADQEVHEAEVPTPRSEMGELNEPGSTSPALAAPAAPVETDFENEQSTSRAQFGDFDFEGAQAPPRWIEKERAPAYKSYRVRNKTGKSSKFTFTVVIYKDKLDGMFKAIAGKIGINKSKIKNMVVSYPIKRTDGSHEIINIAGWDSDLKTSLEVFYGQTESESLLEVEVSDCMESNRVTRPCEKKKSSMSLHNTTDKTVYQTMVSNPSVARKFQLTRHYIAVLLGDLEAVNLLSPVRYVCHLMDCRKVLKLKSFCSISSITAHWTVHENHHDKSCEVLRVRHNYAKSLKKGEYWNTDLNVDELEETKDGGGNPLAIKALMRGKFLAKQNQEFQGKHYFVDNSVVDGILKGSLSVVEDLPDVPSSSNFFNLSS